MNNHWEQNDRRKVIYLSSSLSRQHDHPVPEPNLPKIRQFTPQKYQEWYAKRHVLPPLKLVSFVDKRDEERYKQSMKEQKIALNYDIGLYRQWDQKRAAALQRKKATIQEIKKANAPYIEGLQKILFQVQRRELFINRQLQKINERIQKRTQKIRKIKEKQDLRYKKILQIALLDSEQAEEDLESWKRRLIDGRDQSVLRQIKTIVQQKRKKFHHSLARVRQIRQLLQDLTQ